MKKMVLVIALAAIALSGNAFAQESTWMNNIGIFVDEAGTDNCVSVGAFTPTPAYVVLTKLTASEVWGWEGKLTFDNITLLSFLDRGQAIDAASRADEHIVGFAVPLPVVGNSCVVADVSFYVENANPGAVFVDEVFLSLLENGLPAYIDGSGAGYSMHPHNAEGVAGTLDDPILVVNGTCPTVDVESSTFGGVKSLFR